MLEVEKLARENRFNYLLIQSTGIFEPIPVTQTFTFADDQHGINLSCFSRLDTLVTVVVCFYFFEDFGPDELCLERGLVTDQTEVLQQLEECLLTEPVIINYQRAEVFANPFTTVI